MWVIQCALLGLRFEREDPNLGGGEGEIRPLAERDHRAPPIGGLPAVPAAPCPRSSTTSRART